MCINPVTGVSYAVTVVSGVAGVLRCYRGIWGDGCLTRLPWYLGRRVSYAVTVVSGVMGVLHCYRGIWGGGYLTLLPWYLG